jgi:hypothetical protein
MREEEPEGNKTRGGVTSGQQDERGSQEERIKSDGNEGKKRRCTYKERNTRRYLVVEGGIALIPIIRPFLLNEQLSNSI